MKRKPYLLGLLAVLVLIVAATAACSKASADHWPHGIASNQTRINIWIPPTNPYNPTNDTPEFRAAVANAVAQWNPHPDVRIVLLAPGLTCGIIPSGVVQNCFQAWHMTETTPNPHFPANFPAPSCWAGAGGTGCAFAWNWRQSGHPPSGQQQLRCRSRHRLVEDRHSHRVDTARLLPERGLSRDRAQHRPGAR